MPFTNSVLAPEPMEEPQETKERLLRGLLWTPKKLKVDSPKRGRKQCTFKWQQLKGLNRGVCVCERERVCVRMRALLTERNVCVLAGFP